MSGSLVALLIVVLIAAIILKAAKKVIGIIAIITAIALIMHFVVPLVM